MMMISMRQRVFDFMESNPRASNDEVYGEFDGETTKEKDTLRRYRNQFLKEHEKKESSGIRGISRDVPEISQETSRNEIESDLGNDLGEDHIPIISHSDGWDIPTIPEHVKIAWNDIAGSIESAWGKINERTGKRKWASKYASFQIFKNWMEELLKDDT